MFEQLLDVRAQAGKVEREIFPKRGDWKRNDTAKSSRKSVYHFRQEGISSSGMFVAEPKTQIPATL